ncbi:MAG: dTMP kinase, partial [Chlamydiae bacterium]
MKKNSKRGIFITIEGPDGCGKSTQADFLVSFLLEKNHRVTLTREPGGCSIGEEIREILLKPRVRQDLSDATELFLFAAARAQHVSETILPAMSMGNIVVASRYIDATTAYQGYG